MFGISYTWLHLCLEISRKKCLIWSVKPLATLSQQNQSWDKDLRGTWLVKFAPGYSQWHNCFLCIDYDIKSYLTPHSFAYIWGLPWLMPKKTLMFSYFHIVSGVFFFRLHDPWVSQLGPLFTELFSEILEALVSWHWIFRRWETPPKKKSAPNFWIPMALPSNYWFQDLLV